MFLKELMILHNTKRSNILWKRNLLAPSVSGIENVYTFSYRFWNLLEANFLKQGSPCRRCRFVFRFYEEVSWKCVRICRLQKSHDVEATPKPTRLLANVRASPYQFLKTLTSAFTTTSQTRASEFSIFTPLILSFVLQLRPSTFAEYKCKMDRANVDTSNSDLTKNLSNLVSNCEWQRLSSHPFSIEVEMQKLVCMGSNWRFSFSLNMHIGPPTSVRYWY